MTTHEQNKKAIREGQQGGPAQKNQNAQGAYGAEQDLNSRSGVQQGDQDLPPPQQQQQQGGEQSKPIGNYNPGGQAGESVEGGGQRPANEPGGPFLGRSAGNPGATPGQTGTPGGKGKQDAPQNPRR